MSAIQVRILMPDSARKGVFKRPVYQEDPGLTLTELTDKPTKPQEAFEEFAVVKIGEQWFPGYYAPHPVYLVRRVSTGEYATLPDEPGDHLLRFPGDGDH